MDKKKCYKIWMNCGADSNTWSELLALWMLLLLARSFHIDNIQIIGDSRIIIEWALEKYSLWVMLISPWMANVKHLIEESIVISFSHIYRDYSHLTDGLSKLSVQSREGFNFIECWENIKSKYNFFSNSWYFLSSKLPFFGGFVALDHNFWTNKGVS